MKAETILGANIGEIRYITNCGTKIKLHPQEYFAHVHSCQICRESSPFLRQLKQLKDIEEYPYFDLLGLKSMSEIIIDEINQNNLNQEFYSDEYEEFLLHFAPFICSDCNSNQVPQNQVDIKRHLKTCKDFRENSPFQQELQQINLSLYWDIHKKAFILDILYIINWVTIIIIKKLLRESDRKNHQNQLCRGYKCGKCEQFKDNLIKHDVCNSSACTNCYETHIRKQVDENCLQIKCLNCQNKLSTQLIQKILENKSHNKISFN
ncbi:unnamed protein product [Paramecium pentaurelia]|uniref:Uncharacterized protein n=1 Tax=Paramecium pentaurelia TaxID=43138 RepID=A0A8S1UQM9_9CILI|nr:unnamed protein product [Paramecium pentaurelia]